MGHAPKDPCNPLFSAQESSPADERHWKFPTLVNNLCGFHLEYFIKGWFYCWFFFFPLGNETFGDVLVSAAYC